MRKKDMLSLRVSHQERGEWQMKERTVLLLGDGAGILFDLARNLGDVAKKSISLISSTTDLADALTTKLNLETEAASEVEIRELKNDVASLELKMRKAEAEFRLAQAEAGKAKALAEKRRADGAWRPPRQKNSNQRMVVETKSDPTASSELKEGSREVKRGFTNDSLKNGLTTVQSSP